MNGTEQTQRSFGPHRVSHPLTPGRPGSQEGAQTQALPGKWLPKMPPEGGSSAPPQGPVLAQLVLGTPDWETSLQRKSSETAQRRGTSQRLRETSGQAWASPPAQWAIPVPVARSCESRPRSTSRCPVDAAITCSEGRPWPRPAGRSLEKWDRQGPRRPTWVPESKVGLLGPCLSPPGSPPLTRGQGDAGRGDTQTQAHVTGGRARCSRSRREGERVRRERAHAGRHARVRPTLPCVGLGQFYLAAFCSISRSFGC